MESVLPEWYGHDDNALKQIITTGTVALDTNVLLDLYRMGNEQREQILQVLADVRDHIFIPFQVAFEYQRRRLDVVLENEALYQKLLDATMPKEELLNSMKDAAVRAEVKKLFERRGKPIRKGLEKLRDENMISFDEARTADPVRQALDKLLTEKSLGQRPTEDTRKSRRAIAEQRVTAKIPPGFAEDKPDKTGDYLVWAELLEHAANSNRPLLFVTGDKKKDWYQPKKSGHELGPLPELIAEMHEASPNHLYHQVDRETFLWLAIEFLDSEVDEATIETVRNLSRPLLDSEAFANMYPGLNVPDVMREGMNAALAANLPHGFGIPDALGKRQWDIASSLALQPEYQNRAQILYPELVSKWSGVPPAEAFARQMHFPSAMESYEQARSQIPSAMESYEQARSQIPSPQESYEQARSQIPSAQESYEQARAYLANAAGSPPTSGKKRERPKAAKKLAAPKKAQPRKQTKPSKDQDG